MLFPFPMHIVHILYFPYTCSISKYQECPAWCLKCHGICYKFVLFNVFFFVFWNNRFSGGPKGGTTGRGLHHQEASRHSSWYSLEMTGWQALFRSFCWCSNSTFSTAWFLGSQLITSLHLSRISCLSSILILL